MLPRAISVDELLEYATSQLKLKISSVFLVLLVFLKFTVEKLDLGYVSFELVNIAYAIYLFNRYFIC